MGMQKQLTGAARQSFFHKLVAGYFPGAGEKISTGKKGRPAKSAFAKIALNYLHKFTVAVHTQCALDNDKIAALIGLQVAALPVLTEDQIERLANTKDGKAMDIKDGAPCQAKANTRMLIHRQGRESLETAYLRRINHIIRTAQSESNETRKTLIVVPVRYAICRDARTRAEAEKAGILDLLGMLSPNTMAVYITDEYTKEFKGAFPVAAECVPQKAGAKPRSQARRTLSKLPVA